MTYLDNGKYAAPSDELTALEYGALVLEAHRRGVSYGLLVANTSQRVLDEIIRAYCGEKARRKKRRRLYADDT